MPNGLAYLALALWPLVSVALFRRYPVDRALILTLMIGYLFLPEPPAAFDFPLVPPLTKHTIPALMCFVIILWKRDAEGSWLPESLAAKILLGIFIFSPLATTLNNERPVFFGLVGLPGLTMKDGLALVMQQSLLVLPYLMARQYLRTGESQRQLLLALMGGGLVYSVLMLIEIRLSPQLNLWIYGFYQHQFGQSIRFGGYRPVVFLYHGLWVAFFCLMSTVSALALWRLDRSHGNTGKYALAAGYLTVILVLAKSLGALVFAVALIPLVLFASRRMQIRAAAVIALLALSYPTMKGADAVPEDRIIELAGRVDQDRAASVQFRFDNENLLLDRAREKPVFGWGSWSRNHILDPVTGFLLTVTDGRWIITIGVYGWVGFIAEFGLILLPIFQLLRETSKRKEEDLSPYIAPLTLMLAINVFDMIPNATLTPFTWLMAGALTGYAEILRRERMNQGPAIKMKWQSIL